MQREEIDDVADGVSEAIEILATFEIVITGADFTSRGSLHGPR